MTNVKRYDINYTKLVNQRIPEPLRTSESIAWLVLLASPFISLYGKVISFRQSTLYKLGITPQVVYLEKMLNDRYDATLRRIYILDGQEYNPLYIYTQLELKPVWLYTKSEVGKPRVDLFTAGEVGQFTFDFVVYVPVAISFDVNEMSSLLNTYKLAGKIYDIQTV